MPADRAGGAGAYEAGGAAAYGAGSAAAHEAEGEGEGAYDVETVVAFDSMPSTPEQPDWSDHSGLQLAALTTRPLLAHRDGVPALIGARSLDSSPDGRRHEFAVRPGARWADGSRLTAADYAKALRRAASSHTATGYWLRHVERVHARGDRLRVTLAEPDFGFPLMTSLPALAPYRGTGDGVGRYRIARATSRTIVLDRAGHRAEGAARVLVRRIKSPERGIAAFAEGRIDVTSDTAFPLHRYPQYAAHPALRIRPLGIIVALCFEGALLGPGADTARQAIRRALAAPGAGALLPAPLLARDGFLPVRDFDGAFRGAAEREAVPAGRIARPAPGPRHRLAYDTYYPNRELARAAARLLGRAGIAVELVPDRYEARSRPADLRLNLFRGLRQDPLGVHRGLVFLEALRTHASLESYLKVLRRYDTSPQTSETLEEAVGELDAILLDNALCLPLAEVPGIFLARRARAPWEWT
ncbi:MULTISPECIES: ABC transporter substrate-binding protein [unclassified Streptomyces]|uniref:ABC transporter substrate-binding protein n=1 Tax=unclassified Streptomyces TaxID=2593676 RepID=UPI000DD8C5A6|nr:MULTISPECIES: ABC transporter substrate-binding protein [unclassified Streptomyces]